MLKPMSAVFTLLTISIGEEFEFKFFKILSCVSGDSAAEGLLQLTSIGFDGNMCRAVASCHDQDGEACCKR